MTNNQSGFRICDCTQIPKLHGAIAIRGRVLADGLTNQRSARGIADYLAKAGVLPKSMAEKILQQISSSGLPLAPEPHRFTLCQSCWVSIRHGHFIIDEVEVGISFSTTGALDALSKLQLNSAKNNFEMAGEDVVRISKQILTSGLPKYSDIDILSRDAERRAKSSYSEFAAEIAREIFSVPDEVDLESIQIPKGKVM